MKIGVPYEVERATDHCKYYPGDSHWAPFVNPPELPAGQVVRKYEPPVLPGFTAGDSVRLAETHYKWLSDAGLYIPQHTNYMHGENSAKVYGVAEQVHGQAAEDLPADLLRPHIGSVINVFTDYRDWVHDTDQPAFLYDNTPLKQLVLGQTVTASETGLAMVDTSTQEFYPMDGMLNGELWACFDEGLDELEVIREM